MNCLECNKELSYVNHQNAIDTYGVRLCKQHKSRLDKLVLEKNTPIEAVKLYYGLREIGINSMLEWWDGKKSVDLAISRVKLNIEIDTEYNTISHEQAIMDLEEAMHSFKNGFTTIRIPHVVVKYYLKETVNNIKGIVEGLKMNIKTI
ncbi:hypothetical protein H0I23_09340 [Cellulophaga sp. HaHaR_3_176]|uniref:hypothetical protein n=1 Tax=Cellulophaga sp. HaHaR_3_176 TaxID=1942464 RepID=UPI001C1F706E|nr:hypothetical protein [Cellulophaga sp. HaHaR_3_176]QWX82671.1 hypothetical protein H0I23_09340 [Cellulophaga sp. HaHaR_3_176]